MKATKYSLAKTACRQVAQQLALLAGTSDLPATLKQRILALNEEVVTFDLEQLRSPLAEATGDVLRMPQALQLIKDASGFMHWQAVDVTADKDRAAENPQGFADDFGVSVKAEDIKVFEVTRESSSRDDIWLAVFTCIPGKTIVTLDTGRAGWTLEAGRGEKLIDNAKLLGALREELGR